MVEEKDGELRVVGLVPLVAQDGCWGYVGSRARAAGWV